MAYINKFTSSKEIILKIQRTFRPVGTSWVSESYEDMAWAIQGIGYHGGFEKKSTEPPYISVSNHRGKIPCDVERIIAVESLIQDNSYQNVLNPDGSTTYPLNEYSESCSYKGVRLPLGSDQTGYGLSEDNVRTTNVNPSENYYNLNSDYIITSFDSGLIKLHYIGFALDKNGLPKIVDDADYKMALEWYCFAQMILKGHKHPEVSFKDAFQFWEMYRLRAENAMKVQSIDGAERFKNGFTKVVSAASYGDFFINVEQSSSIS